MPFLSPVLHVDTVLEHTPVIIQAVESGASNEHPYKYYICF